MDILYLSRANIGDLEASSLSAQNKADITKLINEGNYITVPSAEISIGSWSGTGTSFMIPPQAQTPTLSIIISMEEVYARGLDWHSSVILLHPWLSVHGL